MKTILSLFTTMLVACAAGIASAAVTIGDPAPDFSLTGSDGETHSLNQYQGRTVVLEWTNHGCPYVRKHYDSGNMQALQKKYTDQEVVWLAVASSAPGKQGHLASPEEAQQTLEQNNAHATALLMDPSGDTGRAYGASSTPHMFVIDPEGMVVYMGAIDDQPSASRDTVEGAHNYVAAALDAVLAGEAVETAVTDAYGCSVKY